MAMDRLRVLLAPAVCAALFAGCNSGLRSEFGDDIAEEDRYGGIGVIATFSDIPDMNPLTSTEVLASQVQQFMLFLPVIQYDENFRPIPGLARSWEVNQDTTLLTFHLRNDVYWHDGVKTTAYDLALAYERARDPATGFPNVAYWTHYGEGVATDSFTFQVAMRPHAEFMDPWRTFPAVPRHILGEVPAAQLRQHPYSTRQPLGNGPFRFASRIDGQSWTFEANPDFPAELGGRPYLDRVVFRVIPEPTTLLTELLTGSIDFYAVVTPEQAARIEADPNLRLIGYPDRSFVLLGWNQRRPPFDDVRVRRALTLALDRQAIVDAVLYGHGRLANSTVPPFFWQYDAEAGADLGYNPEAARQLLAEAGWTPGPDGMLRNAQGQPFRFTLLTNSGNQVRADVTQIVEAQLRRTGIDVRIQIQEWGTVLDRINLPERRDFDAVLIGWRTDFRIDDSDLFHCDKRNMRYQWVGHCDRRLDVLLDTLPTMADRDAARPLWREYQRLVAEQQPFTFLFYQDRLHGANRRLHNVAPDPRGDWVGIARWWLDPGQRRTR